MKIKGIIFGLLLALFIASFSFFNSHVIQMTDLTANFLPIGIFGVVVLLLLLINPLLRAINSKLEFSRKDLAIATALGLAACSWPVVGFYRHAIHGFTMPPHYLRDTQPSWQIQNVLSYVPGASPLIAQGHVTDWPRLATKILEAQHEQYGPASLIHEKLETSELRIAEDVSEDEMPRPDHLDTLTRAINQILESDSFYQEGDFTDVELNEKARRLLDEGVEGLSSFEIKRLNRALLVSAFPDIFLPPPDGGGLLLSLDEEGRDFSDGLVEGRPEDDPLSLAEIPWHVIWPNILLWGGLALLLAIASLCIALIVHPQWYKREILPYPIVRFFSEATARKPGSWLPNIAYNKHFWVALILIFSLRLLNGFAAWFDPIPEFPLNYNLAPLTDLFPRLQEVPFTWGVWNVALYPTVIGFAFFLNTKVAFSLGIAQYLWGIFGVLLIAQGIHIETVRIEGGNFALLQFGSFLGMGLMICYIGRKYYGNVAAAALGFPRQKETPVYAVWAGRVLLIGTIVSTYLLYRAGLPPYLGVLFLLVILLVYVVYSRIVCETGLFIMANNWLPVGIITALFGIEAIGPTAYIILGIASVVLTFEVRTILMPYLSTGLAIGEDSGESKPSKLSPWLGTIACGSFIVAGAAAMYILFNMGLGHHHGWIMRMAPSMPFDELAAYTSEMSAAGTLAETTASSPLERLSMFSPDQGAYFWVFLGLALVVITAFARLHLPWWPIHPVLFLVWCTWAMEHMGFSFLLGFAIKASVVKVLGAKGYNAGKPIVIGVISGDLLGALLWIIVGIAYYFITGLSPTAYSIFPR